MGIDPGFAATGYAVLRREENRAVCLSMGVVETKKTPKKLMRDLRVSADDYQRVRQIFFQLREVIAEYEPVAISYEVYQPFTGGKAGFRSSAWKVARVEGIIVSLGMFAQTLVLPYLPVDLKKGVAGQLTATKIDIQSALESKILGFQTAVMKLPKGKREHVSDAAGYGYLAFAEMDRLAKMLGV